MARWPGRPGRRQVRQRRPSGACRCSGLGQETGGREAAVASRGRGPGPMRVALAGLRRLGARSHGGNSEPARCKCPWCA
eukprot:11159797-Lingulodinium_polyedra.AAC.1